MVLPLILVVVAIIALAVYYWYITIPLIIIIAVIWHYNTRDSNKKSEDNSQSRRNQSSSYKNYSENDYYGYNSKTNSHNTFEESSYNKKSYEKKSYHYYDNTSKKKKFHRVRMERINARLKKFQITPEDAQIIFGKTWKSKLGKPEWEFYFVVRKIEINVQYDYNNRYRRKFGTLYSKVWEIIKIVNDENPEMRQSEERFEQEYHWDGFWDETRDRNRYDHHQNDSFSEFNEEDVVEAYEIFGLTRNSTKEQIKSKYRELTLKHHPDKNKSVDSTTKMVEINKAYEMIMGAIA